MTKTSEAAPEAQPAPTDDKKVEDAPKETVQENEKAWNQSQLVKTLPKFDIWEFIN